VIKSKIRWTEDVARIRDKRGAYRVLVGGGTWKKRDHLEDGRTCEVNVKMYLQEVGLGDMDWIDLAQDRDWSRAPVNAVMNLRVP
jgi:hypothetical protein